MNSPGHSCSKIHERTISLRFLGIILRVLRLEVSVYNVYISKKHVSNHFARGGGGNLLVEVTANSKEGQLIVVSITSKNSDSGRIGPVVWSAPEHGTAAVKI